MRFVDEAVITVRSGKGGNGSASLRRAKNLPKGGPDGGDGGKGGDVVFCASPRLLTLYDFRAQRLFEAENGQNGQSQDKNGRGGEDLVIEVPVGTQLFFEADDGERHMLADLRRAGQRFVACPGGDGGRGNLHFKSSVNRAPKRAEAGRAGQEKRLRLELKVIADAGLLGLPNAGKSTFLSAVSAARPKIAAYPFTTLTPNLGVVEGQTPELAGRRLIIADIPGLIEGASEGLGLGHTFLKHVERTRFLVHILSGEDADPENPAAGFAMLDEELRAFDPELAQKPQIRVINKIDVLSAERMEALRANAPEGVLFVSALTGEGLPALLDEMWRRMGDAGAVDWAEEDQADAEGARNFGAEPWGEAAGFEDEEE
ncbi:GTP-binding protein [Humidesulfovibrio mexicanus]|uniref:GTPase Obg n=1 Tax=Humidesulfovibrio mexicanus TaxID=147047 RepID=A0A238YA54_9BACT|nr:GTPase ObgE [Humidesulfovibrio mexicanus]SNR67219.1 GTP-binding protein [Humidesulfovibrio mexicanus]